MNSAPSADWIPVVVGLAFAVVIGGTGSLLLGLHRGRRRQRLFEPTKTAPTAVETQNPDPFDHGSPQDKRVAIRRHGKTVTVLVSDREHQSPPTHATVLDRSVGGLRLLTEHSFEVGDVLSVRVSHAAEMIPWVQIEVKNKAKTERGCELGCQFVKTPPTTVLWLFG